MASNVASLYDNGGMIGATLDLGSTEQYILSSTGGTPSIVGTASASGANSVSLTGITGLAEGDLVLVCITSDESTENTTITSSGWTAISDNVFSASINTTIAYKVMGATVDTSIGITSVVDAITVIAMSDVEYLSGASTTSSFGTSIDPPSVTVASDDSIVLVLAAIDDDNSTISSPPTGYTTAVQDGRLGGSNAIMYKTGVSAGTEDPSTLVWSSSDSKWAVTLEFGPTASVTYGNYKNSGIWSMDAVYELLQPLSYEFLSIQENEADATTYNFTSTPLGTAKSNRTIVVAVTHGANPNVDVSSVSVAGSSASIVTGSAAYNPAVSSVHSGIVFYTVALSSGTSGTVSVAFSGTSSRCEIAVWAVYGNGLTVQDTATANTNSSPHTLDVDTVNPSVVLAMAYNVESTAGAGNYDITWSGVTLDDEVNPTASGGTTREMSAASVRALATETRSVSASYSSANFALSSCISIRET